MGVADVFGHVVLYWRALLNECHRSSLFDRPPLLSSSEAYFTRPEAQETKIVPAADSISSPAWCEGAGVKAKENACGRALLSALGDGDDRERLARRCSGGWPAFVRKNVCPKVEAATVLLMGCCRKMQRRVHRGSCVLFSSTVGDC